MLLVVAGLVWLLILARAVHVAAAYKVARQLPARTGGGDFEGVPLAGAEAVERCRALGVYVAGRRVSDIPTAEWHLIRRDIFRRQGSWRAASVVLWVAVAVAAVFATQWPSPRMFAVAGASLLGAVLATVASRSLQDMHDAVALVMHSSPTAGTTSGAAADAWEHTQPRPGAEEPA